MGRERVLGIVFPLSSVIIIPSVPVEDSFGPFLTLLL